MLTSVYLGGQVAELRAEEAVVSHRWRGGGGGEASLGLQAGGPGEHLGAGLSPGSAGLLD